MRQWKKSNKPKKPTNQPKAKKAQEPGKVVRYSKRLLKRDEKEKQQEEKLIKRAVVPGVTKRWIVRTVTALVLVFVIWGILSAYRNNGKVSFLRDQVEAMQTSGQTGTQKSAADRTGTEYFAKQFMKDYITIKRGEDERKKRQDALAPYVADGLNEDVGVHYGDLPGDQIYESSEIVDVKPENKTIADVYMKVFYTYKTEETKQVKEEKEIKKGDKKKTVTREMTVPKEEKGKVAYYMVRVLALKEGGYQVIDYPRPFTPDLTRSAAVEPAYSKEVGDPRITDGVRNFLNSFFKTYTQKEQENELKIYFKDGSPVKSLQGAMMFNEITDLKVYSDQKKNNYIAQTEVTMTNPTSHVASTYRYEFHLVKEGRDKYEITNMGPYTYQVNVPKE